MIIFLTTTSIILFVMVLAAFAHISKINKELDQISNEQHWQNKELMTVIKSHMTHQEMLSQHTDILKYLCERDGALSNQMMYMGPIGEA